MKITIINENKEIPENWEVLALEAVLFKLSMYS
jgi:hypothetical protein